MQAMLSAVDFKKSLWLLAYLWAMQLKIKAPSLALPEITPVQAVYGEIPDLRYL